MLFSPTRLQQSSIAAIVGDKTAVPDDSLIHDEPTKWDKKEDRRDEIECLDDKKMGRICDKLIEVFLVDKSTPVEWRRLLTFSKEWSNIRPHFYRRCQDRADSENDPGMKHQLLRLGRKLKEVGCLHIWIYGCVWL